MISANVSHHLWRAFLRNVLLAVMASAALTLGAQAGVLQAGAVQANDAKPTHLHQRIEQAVYRFVQAQTMGYPGKVSIDVLPLDSRIKVADCAQIEAFQVPGSRLWGKSHIGVRCLQLQSPQAQTPWTLYVQADVQVTGSYAVLALPVSQGTLLTPASVIMQQGDLTKLPNGVITDLAMLEGRQTLMNMPLGTVLRPDMLKAVPVVLPGQTVQLVSRGQGFTISADGAAMQSAVVGQVVDVKVSSGQIVKGIAQANGKVEVSF